jgi:undecaprenyl diphosphate synthase
MLHTETGTMSLLAAPNANVEAKALLDFSRLSDDELEALIDLDRVPRHVAIIMDGNGRWANRRGRSRIEGHRAAVDAVWEAVDECGRLHIEALTLYAFSSENWKRPPREVRALMRLFRQQLRKQTPHLNRNNVRLRGIGDLDTLPVAVRWELARAARRLKGNHGLKLNLALSYGGRQELVRAVRSIAREVQQQRLRPEDITADHISGYLDTESMPDPDLMVRTSGEMRLSNFLLWQSAYAEFYFTPVLWPDFRRRDLYEAVLTYQHRERRFGGVADRSEDGPEDGPDARFEARIDGLPHEPPTTS